MSHAQGTATAAGQIMRSADAGTFFVVQASRGLFVSVYGGDGEAAAGVYFTEKMIAERAYEPVLQTLCAGPRPPRLQCKIAGASSLFAPVTACLAKHGVQVTKAVSRNSELELHFYAATGRILLAKEEKTASLKRKVKVLIVDDSKAMRDLLSHIFSADPEIEVVGAAALPSEVEGLIHARRPDVITLDIHMPEMDGVTLLKQFLPKYPIPTIVISSLTMQEGSLVLSALEHGAIDYVQKPSFAQLKESSGFIIDKIKTAAVAKVIRHQRQPAVRKTAAAPGSLDLEAVIAIGSSTGGPEALRQVLTGLPEKIPAILIAQHIPGVFSLALAERLNGLCAFPVREAVDGEAVVAGQALIAPGGKQMRVKKSGGVLRVVIEEGGKPPAVVKSFLKKESAYVEFSKANESTIQAFLRRRHRRHLCRVCGRIILCFRPTDRPGVPQDRFEKPADIAGGHQYAGDRQRCAGHGVSPRVERNSR